MDLSKTSNLQVLLVPLAILSAMVLPSTNAGLVKFDDCGSTANVTSLWVTGCTEQPCMFEKGQTYDVKITATGKTESNTLPYKVTTKILLVPVTLKKGDACSELSEGACPMEDGAEFTYDQRFTVSKTKFPSVKTHVRALVVDDNANTVICISLAVKVN